MKNKKLHNEEVSDLYSLPNIVRVVKSRRMSWAGHVAHMGQERGVYRVKMDLQEVGGGCGDWMDLAQDRDRWRALVSMVMNLRVAKI